MIFRPSRCCYLVIVLRFSLYGLDSPQAVALQLEEETRQLGWKKSRTRTILRKTYVHYFLDKAFAVPKLVVWKHQIFQELIRESPVVLFLCFQNILCQMFQAGR